MLGCLPQARHTLNKTLYKRLLANPQSGVALQPLAEVRHLASVPGGYAVTYLDHRDGGREVTITAPIVFLAAGTLGTTEILLRSRERGALRLSDALGSRFSTNGDFGGFAVGTAHPVYSTRGPINTCHVQLSVNNTHITIEDCAIPSMFAALASTALGILDNVMKREAFRAKLVLSWTAKMVPDLRDFLPMIPDPHNPMSYRTEAEMVSNIFFFNVMGQDDASGRFELRNDHLDLDWPKPIAQHPLFAKIEDLLKAFSEAMGGRYVALPLWRGLAQQKLIVTHPLGGCPIGRTSSEGVVDEFGRVFDGAKPRGSTDVLPNLYIVDGSVIPGALAANPTLTIAAQAVKAVKAALP